MKVTRKRLILIWFSTRDLLLSWIPCMFINRMFLSLFCCSFKLIFFIFKLLFVYHVFISSLLIFFCLPTSVFVVFFLFYFNVVWLTQFCLFMALCYCWLISFHFLFLLLKLRNCFYLRHSFRNRWFIFMCFYLHNFPFIWGFVFPLFLCTHVYIYKIYIVHKRSSFIKIRVKFFSINVNF